MVVAGLRSALQASRIAPTSQQRLLVASILAAEVAFVLFSFTAPILGQRYGWVSVALAFSCLTLAKAEASRALQAQSASGFSRSGR